MRKIIFLFLLVILKALISSGQGISNNWLIGYTSFTDAYTTSTKATIDFITGAPAIFPMSRKMKFSETQGNISDTNGNLLMSSNGLWIANANNDTMLNGGGLNPGPFTQAWPDYLPMGNCNVFLPWPGDVNKYILFHMVDNPNINDRCSELLYTIIEMNLANGLGGVTQKNQIALQDTFSWGIGTCKHANGRDWWIVVLKDNSNVIEKILLTPNGLINMGAQTIGALLTYYQSAGQLVFSPNGQKFAFTTGFAISSFSMYLKYLNFDRCTGQFSNLQTFPIYDTHPGFGTAFSQDSKYLYASTTAHVFQFNTDSANILATLDTVATVDTFYSPFYPFLANFNLMYLAPDNKIYISSNNSVIDLHYINNPDSGGVACDVQKHALHLPCYQLRGVPNHPNYFLGAEAGSVCDSLTIGINEVSAGNNLSLKVFPNPVTGENFAISYLLEQNKNGLLEVMDIHGKIIHKQQLPQWSTVQRIHAPALRQGLYLLRLTSGISMVTVKMVVMEE